MQPGRKKHPFIVLALRKCCESQERGCRSLREWGVAEKTALQLLQGNGGPGHGLN